MHYDFAQDSSVDFENIFPVRATSETSLSDTMPFVGLGVTAFASRFFLDVYAQRAFAGDDESNFANVNINPPTLTSQEFQSDWDRGEYAVSFGYAVTDHFSLYAGYRLADTEFEEEGTARQFDLATRDLVTTQAFTRTIEYEQDGPFVGGRYGFPIGDAGSVLLNLGIAFIQGTIDEQITGFDPNPTIEGDAVGTTIGLSWTAPLPIQGLNYTISVDGYQFNFDGEEPFAESSFSETVIRGTAGMSYLF
jgi:hypothetical protein